MTDRTVSYTSEGIAVTDNVTPLPALVCTAHPDRPFPHGSCGGPGAPESYRLQVLSDLLRDVRIGAVFGDPTCALWLEKRGIDLRSGADL